MQREDQQDQVDDQAEVEDFIDVEQVINEDEIFNVDQVISVDQAEEAPVEEKEAPVEEEEAPVEEEEAPPVKKEEDQVVYTERSLRERKPKPPPPPTYQVMAEGSSGRKRKANFSMEDKFMLMDMFKRNADILGPDSRATAEKRTRTWEDMTTEFNDTVWLKDGERGVRRTVGEMRKKWRSMCSQARRNTEDMAANGNPAADGDHGWVSTEKALDSGIIEILGENMQSPSDDAWSEVGPESPVENKWPPTFQQSGTSAMKTHSHIQPHTLPVQPAVRSSYTGATKMVNGQSDNVTPVILHTQSLADPAFLGRGPLPSAAQEMDTSEFIRKKHALELEKMQLENSLLRVQLTKANLEVQAMREDMKDRQFPLGD